MGRMGAGKERRLPRLTRAAKQRLANRAGFALDFAPP